ncbi:MAG: DEAD/DEAH box helicase [Nitrospinae bacterium]|nr:DEAD/DEAH box helicase [Nitrospinota bacterium]
MTFESLPIPEPVLKGIREAKFKTCTPIQSKSLPITLARKDLAGQAQTGTGKTAAFLITLLTRLLENTPPLDPKRKSGPRALIIAPTRELARQIEKDALLLGKYCSFRTVCVIGGVDYEKQKKQIKDGVDILIATPGRLIDFYKQKFFSLKQVEVMVVDEADRMFDMGFISDLRYLFRNCSPYNKRQSMLFSATLNHRVMELCYEHMNNPVKVAIEPEKTVVDAITQILYHVGQHEKFNLLLGLMKKEAGEKVLIFSNTKIECENLEWKLNHNGFNAGQISGDLHQKARIRVLEKFQKGEINILIATDVASRGLHIDDITHVINYDLPQDAVDCVHRIGRTARAGNKGTAITLCCEDFAQHLERVEDYLKSKIPVSWPEEELFLEAKEGKPPAKKRRGPPPKAKKPDGRRPAKRPPRRRAHTSATR